MGTDHTMDAWNESSRRYVTEKPEFYIPKHNEWRSAPENSKQGSGEVLDDIDGHSLAKMLHEWVQSGEKLYDEAMKMGVCAEQARLFLPAYGLYVRWYWTTSLQGAAHFVNQRIAHDAQKEIQDYAVAVTHYVRQQFPVAAKALLKGGE